MLRETEEPWYRWTKSAHGSLYKGCPAPPKKRGEKGSLSPYKAGREQEMYLDLTTLEMFLSFVNSFFQGPKLIPGYIYHTWEEEIYPQEKPGLGKEAELVPVCKEEGDLR